MCGIAGVWQMGGAASDSLTAQTESMGLRLARRGPDGAGVWGDQLRSIG